MTLNAIGLLLLLQQPSFALQCGASTQPQPDPTTASVQQWPIIELRQYDLLPGKRDVGGARIERAQGFRVYGASFGSRNAL